MSRIIMLAALALSVTLPSVQAHAQNGSLTRSFVSSTGLDTNACTIAAPCATFAVAYTKISANGIIAALDPGKYGPLTIIGPVTINGNGWAAITGPSGGTAITINAGSGNVTLTGLEIDGAGAASNGIVFNTGDNLTVTNCVVQNFFYSGSVTTGNGILMQPTSAISFAITNSTFSNNGYGGLNYDPPGGSTATANGLIDHVVSTGNAYGISLLNAGTMHVAISNSIASDNSTGLNVSGSNSLITANVDSSSFNNNNAAGIIVFGGGTSNTIVLLGRSVVSANQYGIYCNINNTIVSGVGGSTVASYGDNRINWNVVADFSTSPSCVLDITDDKLR